MTDKKAQLKALQRHLQQDYYLLGEADRCLTVIQDMEAFGFLDPKYNNGLAYLSMGTIADSLWAKATIRMADVLNVKKSQELAISCRPKLLDRLENIPNLTTEQAREAEHLSMLFSSQHDVALAVKTIRDIVSAHYDFPREQEQIKVAESLEHHHVYRLCTLLWFSIEKIWTVFGFSGKLRGIDKNFFYAESRSVLGNLSSALPANPGPSPPPWG